MMVTTLGFGDTSSDEHPPGGRGVAPVIDPTLVCDHPLGGGKATPPVGHPSEGGECFSGTKVKFNFSAICFIISGLRLGVRSVDGSRVGWSVVSG